VVTVVWLGGAAAIAGPGMAAGAEMPKSKSRAIAERMTKAAGGRWMAKRRGNGSGALMEDAPFPA
jgi:hypothetical protein